MDCCATAAWVRSGVHDLKSLIGLLDADGCCLLYTSDAADERSSVDLGGRGIIKKKKKMTTHATTTQQNNKNDM